MRGGAESPSMDMRPEPFEPPAPIPRTVPPSRLQIIRTVMRNPLELWGEPSYTLPWIDTKFINQRTLIVNDPNLIRHVLVENASNYEMSKVRRLILRPILRDGLLTAEGEVWDGRARRWPRCSRRAMPGGSPSRCWRRPRNIVAKYDEAGRDRRGRQYRQRHDRADLWDPVGDAVFRARSRPRPRVLPTASNGCCIAWAASIPWTFCWRRPGCRG